MTVRIVTDSTADLPDFLVAELGITVVPLHIHFGEETYEDGVTISKDEFYKRLVTSPKLPKTSAPSSGAFTETYAQLAEICAGKKVVLVTATPFNNDIDDILKDLEDI